jgi:hypothetical protein
MIQRRRTLLALALVVASGLLVTVGVALVYLPWGLICAGLLLFGTLLLDFDALLAPGAGHLTAQRRK